MRSDFLHFGVPFAIPRVLVTLIVRSRSFNWGKAYFSVLTEIFISFCLLLGVVPSLAAAGSETNKATTFWKKDWLKPHRQPNLPRIISIPKQRYHVRLTTEARDVSFGFAKTDLEKSLHYLPNVSDYLGFSITDARHFGLAFSVANGHPEDPKLFGKTKSTDLRFELPKDSWQISGHFTEYKGFYLDETYSVQPGWSEGQPHVHFPNMEYRSFGARVTFVAAPHRFSLPSLITQTAHQTAKGGSMVVGMQINHERVKNSEPFIPSEVKALFDAEKEIYRLQYVSVIPQVGFGYQYNFTPKYFISGLFALGYGIGQFSRTSKKGVDTDVTPVAASEAGVFAGYNGDTHFWGMRIKYDSKEIEMKSSDYESTMTLSNVYYGFRF